MKFELLDALHCYGCDGSYINNLSVNGIKVTAEEVRIDEYDDCPDIKAVIEINSLEELMKVIDIVGHDLVISDDHIIIYDSYLE